MIPLGILGAATPRQSGGGGDPYWANVVALLHFDGEDESAEIVDETGKTWGITGSAELDVDQYVFGGSSLFVSSAGDDRIDCAHTDFDFGTGDFTIEGFFRPNSTSNRSFFSFGSRLVYVATGNWAYFNGTSNAISGGSVTANSWYHVALSRASGTVRLFINGVVIGSTTDSGSINPGTMRIGRFNPGNPAGSHYDEFRVTNGIARYTSNFTPPDAQFPDFGP